MRAERQLRDDAKAVDAYGEREREYADRRSIEVVLLGADSECAIRVTHPIYFREEPLSIEPLADLRGLVARRAAG